MVKNGCLPDLSGIWVTKKPLKFSDFLIVVYNKLFSDAEPSKNIIQNIAATNLAGDAS